MNKTNWDSVLESRLKKSRETLSSKAGEYASTEDRFYNFKVAAWMTGETPEQALYGMMLKHMVSVKDIVDWTATEPERITEFLTDEKIGDHINYLILLEGLLIERLEINKG